MRHPAVSPNWPFSNFMVNKSAMWYCLARGISRETATEYYLKSIQKLQKWKQLLAIHWKIPKNLKWLRVYQYKNWHLLPQLEIPFLKHADFFLWYAANNGLSTTCWWHMYCIVNPRYHIKSSKAQWQSRSPGSHDMYRMRHSRDICFIYIDGAV